MYTIVLYILSILKQRRVEDSGVRDGGNLGFLRQIWRSGPMVESMPSAPKVHYKSGAKREFAREESRG